MSLRARVLEHRDAVFGVALAALYLVEIYTEPEFRGTRQASVAIAILFAAAFSTRRRTPIAPLVTGFVIILLGNGPIRQLPETAAFLVGMVASMYAGGRYADGRQFAGCVLVTAASIPFAAFEPGQPIRIDDVGFFLMFFGGPIVAGRLIRRRHVRELELEGEADTRAAEAVAEERTRIARELHDVVAHAISVIVLQARGGRRVLDASSSETREALDAIEATGAEALVEMRRLLGMLRAGDDALALAPQPSLARVGDLADQMGAAGLPVQIVMEGDPCELPPGVDVSAYRIVQEALTNALKHAGPARAKVTLRYEPDAIEIEITDDGAGAVAAGAPGYGLAGIRERVEVYGGELAAGARADGGFALRARLPLDGGR